MKKTKITFEDRSLAETAYSARSLAVLAKPDGTRVGCAIQVQEPAARLHAGRSKWLVVGANIEGPWHTSIHAEVAAIARALLDGGRGKIVKVAIAADVEKFTPCGSCLDWLIFACHPDAECIVRSRSGLKKFMLRDLYKEYPRK